MENESDILRRKLAELSAELEAYKAQASLLESFVSMAGSTRRGHLLKSTLQTVLDSTSELTRAEKGSLFLFDDEGKVVESILSRAEVSAREGLRLIGQVMDDGLAGWVGRTREIGLIVDTDHDDRWVNLPDQPYAVRSALAVPLTRGERLLGLLTLLHSRPGHFNRQMAQITKAACDQMALTLENARLYDQVETFSEALNWELEKGRRIQRDFLPQSLPCLAGWEFAFEFQPAEQVSGDFLDVFPLESGSLVFLVGDVSDKGVAAALLMVVLRTMVRFFLQVTAPGGPGESRDESVFQAITEINDYLHQNHPEGGMFATVFFGVLRPESGRLRYVSCGHDPAMIVGENGLRKKLMATGPALGLVPSFVWRIEEERIDYGEQILCFTDGVTDAASPDGRFFTRSRLEELLLEPPPPSAAGLIQRIEDAISRHTGRASQHDDIAMLCLRRSAE
jgi:sigma-B regulation protein RsbU (phosphoserine phosphatase)